MTHTSPPFALAASGVRAESSKSTLGPAAMGVDVLTGLVDIAATAAAAGFFPTSSGREGEAVDATSADV